MNKPKFPVPVLVIAVCLLGSLTTEAIAYQLNRRWSQTAHGPAGVQGDAITLTWGFSLQGTDVPGLGGPSLGPNELISFLDTQFGDGPGGDDLTQRPWFTRFEESFDRWGQLGGVSYVYEPNDDGVQHGSQPGALGVRADMRIAGARIDGRNGVLAFNNFPDNGDMVLDVAEAAFYRNPQQNYRRLRNVIMHEHGHGFGAFHVVSGNARFLMEPTIDVNFDGPQLDDIRGFQRGYGDVNEKSNGGLGNDTFDTATPLGSVTADNILIGEDAGPDTIVEAEDIDFVSIDDNSDTDFYTFEVTEDALVTAVLTPLGPTYNETSQNGPPQQPTDTSAISDLSFALLDTDGTSVLRMADMNGLGEAETVANVALSAGTYYLRVDGLANDIQMYQLHMRTVPEPAGVILLCGGLLAVAKFRSSRTMLPAV